MSQSPTDRVLLVHDLRGQPINVLLSLPGECPGDRVGQRRDPGFGLVDELTVQCYEGRSPAKPLGRLLGTYSPLTLARLSADFSLNGPNVISLATVQQILQWVRAEEHKAEAYKHFKPTPHHRSRLSPLANRVRSAGRLATA